MLADRWLRAQITVFSGAIGAPNLVQRAALLALVMMIPVAILALIALIAVMIIEFTLAKVFHNLDDIA